MILLIFELDLVQFLNCCFVTEFVSFDRAFLLNLFRDCGKFHHDKQLFVDTRARCAKKVYSSVFATRQNNSNSTEKVRHSWKNYLKIVLNMPSMRKKGLG